MKPKKLMFVPVLLVALASCSGGSKISKEDANLRVSAAFDKTANETFKSVDLALELKAVLTHKAYSATNKIIEDDKIEINGKASAKAKDLDKATAQIAVTASGNYDAYSDGKKMMGIKGDIGLYYVDNFGYTSTDMTVFDGESGKTTSETIKSKVEAGPFPGLDDIFGSLGDLTGGNFEPEDGMLDAFLPEIGSVTATEKKGALTVKYEIVQDDVVDIVFALIYGTELDDVPAEDLAAARELVKEMVDEALLIRKLAVTIVVNSAGYFGGLDFNVDLDIIDNNYGYWDDVNEEFRYGREVITVKGSVNLTLKINEEVKITFPKFDDYLLIEA